MSLFASLIPAALTYLGNQSAQSAANKASAKANQLTDRQVKLFDTLMGLVQDADGRGAFSPDERLKQLGMDFKTGQEATAGAARIAGYKPGDSPVRDELTSRTMDYSKMAGDIRRSALFDKIGAYKGIDPSQLNPAIGQYNNQQQMALSRMQDPSGILSGLMGTMGKQKDPFADFQSSFRLPSGNTNFGNRPGVYR